MTWLTTPDLLLAAFESSRWSVQEAIMRNGAVATKNRATRFVVISAFTSTSVGIIAVYCAFARHRESRHAQDFCHIEVKLAWFGFANGDANIRFVCSKNNPVHRVSVQSRGETSRTERIRSDCPARERYCCRFVASLDFEAETSISVNIDPSHDLLYLSDITAEVIRFGVYPLDTSNP
jgi:hypothetical protein